MDSFEDVATLIFGDGAYELVRKMNPTQSDLAAQQKKSQKRQAQVGLASNIVGIGAGVAGTAEAYNKLKSVRSAKGKKGSFKLKGDFIPKGVKNAARAAGDVAGKVKTRHVVGLAGAGLGLQVANVAGDAVANRVLAREAKKKPVQKRDELGAQTVQDIPMTKGKLVAVGVETARKTAPKVKQKVSDQLSKVDVTWEGEFSKFDTDKRQVFGWASVVEINGEPVIDRQGDMITADEIEKAAYTYVVKSRKGGDMHRREQYEEGERPFHASDMIESFMVTPEKLEKMGLPKDSLPTGWWVGYQVNDDTTWNLVKSGHRTGFSIHGRGKRKDV